MNASSEAARTSRVSAADRQARARRTRARPPPARHPEREAAPVEVHEQAEAREHQQAHRPPSTRPRAPAFSDEQPGLRHQAAHQPRERVLLALERERAGRQQQRDEHQRHGRRASATANDVSEVRAAVQRPWPSPDRLAHDGQHVVRERQVLARELREARSPRSSCGALGGAGRQLAAAPWRGSPRRSSGPSTSKFWPRKLYSPPLLIRSSSWSASLATRLVSARVGGLHLRLDRVLDELPAWPGPRRCSRPRPSPARAATGGSTARSLGMIERAEHVAVLDLLDRLLLAVHAHRVDGVEQPRALLREVDPVAAQLDHAADLPARPL